MGCLRKEVHRLDLGDLIAFLAEDFDVAGQGGGVAGDVGDGGDGCLADGFKDFGVADFAGWVKDNMVGLSSLFGPLGEPGFGFGLVERGVRDGVSLGVGLGVADSLADRFDPNNLANLISHMEADGSDAGIKV